MSSRQLQMLRTQLLGAIAALVLLLGTGTVKADGNETELNQIGAIYESGEYALTVVRLKEYLSRYAQDSLAWTILGHAYEELDQDKEADASYEKALSIDPTNYRAVTGRGILSSKKGDLDQAQKYYEQAIRINPQYAQAYSSVVSIALKRGDIARAVEYGEKGYALDPNDATIAANLAVAYHYVPNIKKRDEMAAVARTLKYRNSEALERIFKGEVDVRLQ